MIVKAGMVKRFVEDTVEKVSKKNNLGMDQQGELYLLVFNSLFNKVKVPKYLKKSFELVKQALKKELKAKVQIDKGWKDVIIAYNNATKVSKDVIKRLKAGENIDIVTKDIMSLRPAMQTFVVNELKENYPKIFESIIKIVNMPPKVYAVLDSLRTRGLNAFANEIIALYKKEK